MSLRMILAAMLRESRGSRGRLVFFTACLAIGVAAVVGVAGLVASVEAGLREQSGKLLGADLSVEGRRELPEEVDAFAAELGARRTDVRELATMVSLDAPDAEPPSNGAPRGPRSRLVELRAVQGTFPYYGELGLEPKAPLAELLDAGSAIVAPELARELRLRLGDPLWIGGQRFQVAALLLDEPDRLDFTLALGPRVLLSGEGLARTDLLGTGSRVRYRALLQLPRPTSSAELERLEEELEERLPEDERIRVQTRDEAQPAARRGLERTGRFLGLVALLSLVLGGVGVAQIVRAWIAERTAAVAVLRCIGMRPREIVAMYTSHVALLALVGSAAGALLGGAVPWLAPLAAPDLLPADLVRPWQPGAVVRGLLLGVGIALLFSLPQLLAVWRVPPARVLRSEAEPLPIPRRVRAISGSLLLLGLFTAAWLQAEDLELAAWFSGGLAVLAAALYAGARLVVRLARAVPRARLDPYLRSAVAALGRPGAGTVGAIVALGLGVLVVAGMALIERRLEGELRGALPEDAPTVFFADVQPDQWADIEGTLAAHGAVNVNAVPMAMARLSAIDGVPVSEVGGRRDGRRRGRWVLTREQRLTWMQELPADNRLVAGELWSRPDVAEVSLEEDFADDLGAVLGTRLTFDVQGVPVDLTVTSLRTVDWQSFGINFFLVAEPGALDDAPHVLLAAARLEPAGEDAVQDAVAARHPNVTLLRVRPILEKLLGLMTRLAFAVRALGAFTIVTGLAILAGVASTGALQRAREAALLKTLGVTRRGVAALLLTEYALVGAVAGAVGGLGALALAWGFLERVVELPAELPWLALPFAILATAVLAALCGLAASARALTAPPLASLR